jgi:outer membrane protein assembly factor BamB
MKHSPFATGLVTFLLLAATCFAGTTSATWPQFRGPNGSGVAHDQDPPVEFDAQTNLLWQVPIPPGASSPCIWGDRIFLTAFDNNMLETLCLRRADGQVLWRKTAPVEALEIFHPQEGSPAAATPVTEGEKVYAYFGSCGLVCYDFAGVEQWRHLLPPLQSFGGFGSGASPVLAEGLIILNLDQVGGSQLVAVNALDGKLAWRTERGRSFGWCTPAIWEHDSQKEIVLPASAVLKGYDLKTGAERWTIRGISAATCSTPTIGEGLLFVSSWSTTDGSNAPPPFSAMLEKFDKDHDGALSLEELSGSELAPMFQALDLNRDQRITRDEYEPLRSLATRSKNVLLAVRPGGTGDITDSHVVWSQNKGLPYVSSPLSYQGRLYLVKDGGMVSSFESQTGKPIYLQERLGPLGNYYASPVAAHGRVYVASASGVVTVFEAGDSLNVLARNDLRERISATPAIVQNTLYVRTAKHLFAFARQPASKSATIESADETALFDGKTLKGWKDSGFTGSGKIQVQDGRILLGLGFMTGITWTNDLPSRMDYEISLEAMRVDGSDFFCGLTFPVGENSCSLIVGGWGGSVVGLSSLDYADAANNETTQFMQFENGRWYKIRVRVESDRIRAWIDEKQVVDVKTTGRKISIRSECELSVPLGVATWSTAAAVRNIKLLRL